NSSGCSMGLVLACLHPILLVLSLELRFSKTARRREFWAVKLLSHDCCELCIAHDLEGKTMRKIVKEPFAPKRRHIDSHESRVGGWWRALFAVVSLIFLKGNPSRIIRERFSLSRSYFHLLSRRSRSNPRAESRFPRITIQ